MRWGSGFFRLWVVLSAIWLCAVAAITADSFPHERQPWHMVVADDGLERWSITQVREAAIKAARSGDSDGSHRLHRMADDADKKFKASREAAVKNGLILGLSFPLITFMAGLAVSWIARGFRPKSD